MRNPKRQEQRQYDDERLRREGVRATPSLAKTLRDLGVPISNGVIPLGQNDYEYYVPRWGYVLYNRFLRQPPRRYGYAKMLVRYILALPADLQRALDRMAETNDMIEFLETRIEATQ